jgi:transposase
VADAATYPTDVKTLHSRQCPEQVDHAADTGEFTASNIAHVG